MMKIDRDAIVTELKNGTTLEEIAKAFTEAINGANTDYLAEREKHMQDAAKRSAAKERISDAVLDYLREYDEDGYNFLGKAIEFDKTGFANAIVKSVEEITNSFGEEMATLKRMMMQPAQNDTEIQNDKSDTDALDKFLKAYGLK